MTLKLTRRARARLATGRTVHVTLSIVVTGAGTKTPVSQPVVLRR
jgi:hypothetical protein